MSAYAPLATLDASSTLLDMDGLYIATQKLLLTVQRPTTSPSRDANSDVSAIKPLPEQ